MDVLMCADSHVTTKVLDRWVTKVFGSPLVRLLRAGALLLYNSHIK